MAPIISGVLVYMYNPCKVTLVHTSDITTAVATGTARTGRDVFCTVCPRAT
jgi:hypothetical protein